MDSIKLKCHLCGKIAASHVEMNFTPDGGMNGYLLTWYCSDCNISVEIRVDVAEEEKDCIEKAQKFFGENKKEEECKPLVDLSKKCKTCSRDHSCSSSKMHRKNTCGGKYYKQKKV